MSYNDSAELWPKDKEYFFKDRQFIPLLQEGPHCVSTSLAILTGEPPEYFQQNINTQDPVSWSDALHPWEMKLAYCPYDARQLGFYMDELVSFDDLFLLCYYMGIGDEILKDPDRDGWICSSHIVVLHRDKILDPAHGDIKPAHEHRCNKHHTKRIFRVIPTDHPRGL